VRGIKGWDWISNYHVTSTQDQDSGQGNKCHCLVPKKWNFKRSCKGDNRDNDVGKNGLYVEGVIILRDIKSSISWRGGAENTQGKSWEAEVKTLMISLRVEVTRWKTYIRCTHLGIEVKAQL